MKLPQLSLRDLFWLVLVCALAVGWWVERESLKRQHFADMAEVARLQRAVVEELESRLQSKPEPEAWTERSKGHLPGGGFRKVPDPGWPTN